MMKKETKKKKDAGELTNKLDKNKLLKGIGVVAIVLCVLGLAFFVSKEGEGSSFEFTNITIDEYLEILNGTEKSIVYVARPGCSWCQKESPIIKRLGSRYNLTIYYLNTDEFFDANINDYSEDGYKFLNAAEPYKSEQKFGTPNTIIVQNGEILDGKYGYVELSELTSLFRENGLI